MKRKELIISYQALVFSFFLFLSACAPKSVADIDIVKENIEEITIPQTDDEDASILPPPFSEEVVLLGDKPILHRGQEDSWDSSLIIPGVVVKHGSLFHLFYTGMKITRQLDSGGIGYAISTNGYDWHRVADAPLLTWEETVGTDLWIRVSDVYIDESGEWTLYFSSNSRAISEEASAIWRATASTPTGPWEFDDIPLLEAGSLGAWDQFGVIEPVVLEMKDSYRMYYLNQRRDNRNGLSAIGMATSTDRISWTKYNDPTTEQEFTESDFVKTLGEGTVGFQEIQAFDLWQDDTGYGMLFFYGGRSTNTMSYANSSDGIVWTDSENNPLLTADNISFLGVLSAPRMIYLDNKYHFYFYGSADQNRPSGEIYMVVEE
ncbi:MAG: hypothetical protein HN392_13855 [Anaerolineae bacterium]|jgi:predicted GH43/DUF377 family glycosyl hydrolase|nr:hypothetical protein [Anaerolineae bacterium]MBT7073500.1 hypothetical protein [Anaerolineae bacterium]MBT7783686.1 hypothetical protein [Anaerolineae bacterium]